MDAEAPRTEAELGSHAGEIAHAAARGAIAAMAMTGMRVFTVHVGIVEEAPPEAIFRQKARGLLKRVPGNRGVAAVELAHWAYGAAAGAVFGALASIRLRAWAAWSCPRCAVARASRPGFSAGDPNTCISFVFAREIFTRA